MNHGNCIEQPIDQIQRKDGSGIAFFDNAIKLGW